MIYFSFYFFHHIPSIAFKFFNLGQSFRVAFHKLPTINWVNFGPFILTELVYLSQVCRPPCSHTRVFSSAHKFSIGLRSGLCDGLSNTLTVVLKPFCHNFGSMLGVIVHLEDPFATKL